MSREIPFQPMGRNISTTTPEQMQAKLARRCQEVAQRVVVDVQPQPEPDPARLVWKKVSDWCIETVDGQYRIEKFAPGEDVLVQSIAAHKYRCFKLVPGHWFWQFDLAADPKTARAACESEGRVDASSSQTGCE